ncbi:MAG: purine-nucleoside phosphorylase [Bacteroidales bacterium]|nr:purine-nucleoside phosphorylase [Bacteroidales bacterium]
MTDIKHIHDAVRVLQSKGIKAPLAGIILGTGLGKLTQHIRMIREIPYSAIPDFPISTVEFHKGRFVYGELEGKRVLAMQGRFHFYEGYSLQQIALPVRVMKLLGIKHLLISNAGGAVNLNYEKGSLMLLDDHINLLGGSPLIGPNHTELGPRFPDMSRPYSAYLNEKIERIAKKNNIVLHKGVYVAVPGPNLETRAEYRFLRTIGADTVGMSTVPEAIAANHINLPCAAISVITDICDPDHLEPLNITDILKTAALAEENLIVIIKELIREL